MSQRAAPSPAAPRSSAPTCDIPCTNACCPDNFIEIKEETQFNHPGSYHEDDHDDSSSSVNSRQRHYSEHNGNSLRNMHEYGFICFNNIAPAYFFGFVSAAIGILVGVSIYYYYYALGNE